MILNDGLEIEDSLITDLIKCGEQAHEISQAHHLDPGSNGFTFGSDRYHRATELSTPFLEDSGFRVTRKGAGLRAAREGLELHFATARGSDLTNKANFDIGASNARHRAAQVNLYVQNSFEGIDFGGFGGRARSIIHVIWSGDIDAGLTAVYVGKMIEKSGQHLEWEELVRVDGSGIQVTLDKLDDTEIPMPTYEHQPEPVFHLGLISDEKSNVN